MLLNTVIYTLICISFKVFCANRILLTYLVLSEITSKHKSHCLCIIAQVQMIESFCFYLTNTLVSAHALHYSVGVRKFIMLQ